MKRASDRNFFELAFLATETEASAGISALAAHFRSLGLSEEHAGEVRIALTEAINNVVEHAYAGVEPAQVRINCRQTQDRLDILVSDTGNPLPGGKVPLGEPADVDTCLQELPEGGFGWFLIRQIANDIKYERKQGYNRLSLRFDMPQNFHPSP